MARKFGKKNEIQLDPLAYNIGLIGSSGIGKSTLIKEVCEKLVGENGYIALDMGKEDGHSAISGIITQPIPDWNTFQEFCEDVIENKNTDYKELRVVVIDTIDQLFDITEPEVIRLHNKENPDKPKITSINQAYGGFGQGLDKAIELVLNMLWRLKEVGVSFIVIGHTKTRDIEDPTTGEVYSILTTNISQRYFNAIKTKLHFLGVAYIDREIVKVKTGKKNIVTKKEEEKGKVLSESRRITFRDDNYSIDSKSRFAEIISEIPLDSDAFIKALQDAILAEHNKGDKTVEETMKDMEKVKKQKAEKAKEKAEELVNNRIDIDRNYELMEQINEKRESASVEAKKAIKPILVENNISNLKNIEIIPTKILEKILEVLS